MAFFGDPHQKEIGISFVCSKTTLPKTVPQKQWLEDKVPFGMAYFPERTASFRERISLHIFRLIFSQLEDPSTTTLAAGALNVHVGMKIDWQKQSGYIHT